MYEAFQWKLQGWTSEDKINMGFESYRAVTSSLDKLALEVFTCRVTYMALASI